MHRWNLPFTLEKLTKGHKRNAPAQALCCQHAVSYLQQHLHFKPFCKQQQARASAKTLAKTEAEVSKGKSRSKSKAERKSRSKSRSRSKTKAKAKEKAVHSHPKKLSRAFLHGGCHGLLSPVCSFGVMSHGVGGWAVFAIFILKMPTTPALCLKCKNTVYKFETPGKHSFLKLTNTTRSPLVSFVVHVHLVSHPKKLSFFARVEALCVQVMHKSP